MQHACQSPCRTVQKATASNGGGTDRFYSMQYTYFRSWQFPVYS